MILCSVAHSIRDLVASLFSILLEPHWPLAPDAILLIPDSVYVEQPPSRREKPVDFLSASGFQVVPGKFHDIQLP